MITDYFKRILKDACVWFTAISVLILSVQLIFGEESDYTTVTPFRFILIYPYSLLISGANILMKYTKLNYFVRAVCHYFAVIWGFFFLMYLPASMNAGGSTLLVAISLLTLTYVILFTVVKLIKGALKSKANKEKEYDSIFGGKNERTKR